MYLFSQDSVWNVCAVWHILQKEKINKNTQVSLQNKIQQHKDKQELYSRIFSVIAAMVRYTFNKSVIFVPKRRSRLGRCVLF